MGKGGMMSDRYVEIADDLFVTWGRLPGITWGARVEAMALAMRRLVMEERAACAKVCADAAAIPGTDSTAKTALQAAAFLIEQRGRPYGKTPDEWAEIVRQHGEE
jgi:hypothetical protein